MSDENSPIQDAVVAFCVLVRAVADGNQAKKQERDMLKTLDKLGFQIRVNRESIIRIERKKRKAIPGASNGP